jgi:hypothetical protein
MEILSECGPWRAESPCALRRVDESDRPPDQTEAMSAQGAPARLKHAPEESFKPTVRTDESEIDGLAVWTAIGQPAGEQMFHDFSLPV